MTTTNTPLVLPWSDEAAPYREALEPAGLDARVDVVHGPLAEAPAPDLGDDNLERFLAGRPLRETVDRARGY